MDDNTGLVKRESLWVRLNRAVAEEDAKEAAQDARIREEKKQQEQEWATIPR